MKQTIGRYFNIKDHKFPLILDFNDFYYYEAVTGEHLLLHTITGKRTMQFYLPNDKCNILQQINKIFEMDLDSINIDGLYWATKDSQFSIHNRNEGTSGSSGMFSGSFSFNMDWENDYSDDDKTQSVTKMVYKLCEVNVPDTLTININTEDLVNAYPRPPTA
jgi:hypothetical protein